MQKGKRQKRARVREAQEMFAASEKEIRRWGAMVLLIMAAVSLASVTTVVAHNVFADMRYMVSALPFVMLMLAACADWAWTKHKVAGAALLSVLLFSNFAGVPFVVQGSLCTGRLSDSYLVEERFPLFALAGEIHRDVPSAISEAVAYLRTNANQDDTIVAHPAADSAVLLHYLSDKLIFCCGLSDESPLPEEKIRALGAPLYKTDGKPDWIVNMNHGEGFPPPEGYEIAHVGGNVAYPVHRPEMEYHCFGESNLPIRAGIFRRNKNDADADIIAE